MWSIKSILLLGMLCLIAMSVSAASVITAPSGTFQPSETQTLPVTVAGINAASGVQFNLTYNKDLFAIDEVTSTSSFPSASVTTNINNQTGVLIVAVTDTNGITAMSPTPLVNIKFRSLGGTGTTATTIPSAFWSDSGTLLTLNADSPTIFDPHAFDTRVTGSLEVRSVTLSEIRIGNGVLSSGSSVRIPVSIANLTSANNITVNVMFNSTHFVIEDAVINNSVISGTEIVLSDSSIANTYGHAMIHVKNANITGSGLTPVFDLVVRPTNWVGTDDLNLHYSYYSTPISPYNYFSLMNSGVVTSSGAGTQPGDGAIRFATASISGQSIAKYSIDVQLPAGARKIWAPFTYNASYLNITAVATNATANATGAYVTYANLYTGSGSVTVENTQGLSTVTFTPLIDVTLKTFSQYGTTPFILNSWESPNYVVSSPASGIEVMYPFRTVTNGSITVIPTLMPDLVGEIVEAPLFVKKYADGSLHFNTTFAVHNIGYADTASNFIIQGKFGDTTQNLEITDNIPAQKTMMMFMVMNVIPNKTGGTDVSLLSQGLNKTYTIVAGGNIGVGSYDIGLSVDVNNNIGEINETNNNITHTAPITQPDLIPTANIQFISSSGTTVVNSFAAPGTYTVNYGVKNRGDVFAVPTSMNVTLAGTKKIFGVPLLKPGEMYNFSEQIQITKTSSPDMNIVVNANRSEAETNYNNNTFSTTYKSFTPVTIDLPRAIGTTETVSTINITVTNVTTTITDITFPFRYDPTVCSVSSISGLAPGISATQSYGRVQFTGSGLSISSNTTIGQVNLRAQTNEGRAAALTSDTSAIIKTEGTKRLDLVINSGAYNQLSLTDARLSVWVPSRGPVNNNQTISLSVYNYRSNPVSVNVSVSVDDVVIWRNPRMNLTSWQSKYINIPTWNATTLGKHWVNASLTGDDLPVGNTSVTSILIEDYQLNITTQNKQYWEWYYGYNKTTFLNEYFWLGTYYSSNQGSMVNGTVRIWDSLGNPVNLADEQTFDFYYYYPPFEQWYGYNSDWNYFAWYSIKPKKIGVYNYSITLDSRGKITFVNGTIVVQEPYVDIKVVNSTSSETNTTLYWDVFVNGSAINKQAIIKLAAGSEGRTLQGLNYLTYYPYGCPEQTMSPTLAALRILQYNEKRGTLTSTMRDDLTNKIKTGVDIMSAPGGSNAQQLAKYKSQYGDGSGGTAWGKNSQPSMFYTMYPNYVMSEVYLSNQTYWGTIIKNDTYSFNESVAWLINKQRVTKNSNNGSWIEYGYISDPYIWTGWCMLKFDHEYDLLSGTMKNRVNWSMQNATFYLMNLPYTSSSTVTNDARSFTVMGLKGIENRIGNPTLNATIDAKVANISAQLLANQNPDGSWNGGGYWYVNKEYTTAQVLKALNASGIPSNNASITKGIRYLVGIYNSGGRWSNTATTAGVMEAILQLQPETFIDGTADITIYNNANTVVKQMSGLRINNTDVRGQSHSWTLSNAELQTLYAGNSGKAKVVLSNWVKNISANDVQLVMSVDSRMQLPITIAYAIPIPDQFIDPIADNFTLSVSVPTGMKEGDTGDVGFTINTVDEQYVMIINVPVNTVGGAQYIGSVSGTDQAYYLNSGVRQNLSHQFNSTDNTVAFFPGSDNETAPSLLAGQSKTFYLPLKFNTSGTSTVQARAYPMYDDEWMALGNGSAYVKGYGNITLAAVDQIGTPVMTANFFVNNTPIASGTNTTSQSILEGQYAIAIQNASSWVNVTLAVTLGDTATYTGQFTTDTTVPHAASVTGGSGDVSILPPSIVETVSNSSTNHWNAIVIAMKSFNSTISSSGGYVTVEVDVPTVMNRANNSVNINETISVSVHNATGWFAYSDYTVLGSILRINNVNTADIDQIMIEFNGLKLGDVGGNGVVTIGDARDVAWYVVGQREFTGNQAFYADVGSNGAVSIGDARDIAWYVVGSRDVNYQPI